MSDEPNENQMELEENQNIPQEQIINNNENQILEEKKELEEKPKKKVVKRAPMEKTVDDTIKEFDKLLQDEVNILFYFF